MYIPSESMIEQKVMKEIDAVVLVYSVVLLGV